MLNNAYVYGFLYELERAKRRKRRLTVKEILGMLHSTHADREPVQQAWAALDIGKPYYASVLHFLNSSVDVGYCGRDREKVLTLIKVRLHWDVIAGDGPYWVRYLQGLRGVIGERRLTAEEMHALVVANPDLTYLVIDEINLVDRNKRFVDALPFARFRYFSRVLANRKIGVERFVRFPDGGFGFVTC